MPATLTYPNFTRDGQSVIGYSFTSGGIYGFTLRERRLEKRADLGFEPSVFFEGLWNALDPTDAPIVLSDQSRYEIYALDLEQP